jgi:hypothetical protein
MTLLSPHSGITRRSMHHVLWLYLEVYLCRYLEVRP